MNSNDRKTLYLDVASTSSLVKQFGMRTIFRKLVDQLKGEFSKWDDFDKCPRTANHSPLGVVELMPISNQELFSFKYVNGHPKNPDIGLTTVMAFGALSEMNTGFPLLISEMTLLTAIRTAATSALVGSYLARKNSNKMAMIGNGAQSEFQIIAFNELLGISEFILYDIDPLATDKLVENLKNDSKIKLTKVHSISEAVRGCDIVTTCTADKKKATILTLDHVESGMFINAIGGDCPGKTELQKEILNSARVVVEYAPQTRIEGEIQQIGADFKVTELHELVRGKASGRQNEKEVTIFDSVGFSLEDFSVLKLMYQLALDNSLGQKIEITPNLKDVKDLYSLIT